MYAEFYSLTGLPFQLTPDPRFFFGSSEHNRAMAHLTYGIDQGEGFIIITGDVGAGKTTLVDHLLSGLDPAGYVAAKVVTTQLRADDMLRMVAATFGVFSEGADKASLLKRIEEFLGATYVKGKRVLLVIDECQNLTIEALEELRMLSNIVVRGTAPMQSILLGQPQFRTILGKPDLDQLRQRVTASYHLGPLNAAETRSYIEHRLTLVGWKHDPAFSESSFHEIYNRTGGIPRRINTLCSRLMLLCYLEERHAIETSTVAQVAEELATELGSVVATGVTSPAADDSPKEWPNPETASAVLPEQVLPKPARGADFIELDKRISRIEQSVTQHDRAIRRALEIVVKYLNGAGA